MTNPRERAIQVGLVVLAVPQLVTGIWAVVNPEGWFRNFPGLGQHWVTANPGGYNHHLVADAGAGFLATGAALVLALLWREQRVRQVALVALLFQIVPHAVFHLAHPAHALSAAARTAGTGGLVFSGVLAFVMLIAVSRPTPERPGVTPAATATTTAGA